MTTITQYAPYLIAGAFICGAWFGFFVCAVLSMARDDRGCTGSCEQGRLPCDCVPKIGYPTEEEA